MLKLAFFIHSLSSGGAERVTANLANYWADKGGGVSIITLADVKKDFYRLDERVERIALNLTADSGNPLTAIVANLRRIVALRRELKRVQPDIAVGMMTTANVLLAFAARGLPIVTIGSERIHPPMLPLGRAWEWLRRLGYGYLQALVVLTQESCDWVRQHTRARTVAVIPNAVNWPLAMHAPVMPPEEYLVSGRRVLISVGRLDTQKGFDLLIDAFTGIASPAPDWDLVILGEGAQQEALMLQIKDQGLKQRIRLPGRVGNIADWYNAADLYVMSSRFEGFPNTLVEAMAHGLPAVSFDCDTGPRDIIRHEVDGLLVENGNVEALTLALHRLMTDRSIRQQFAVRAVEVRGRFSMEKVTGMWEELFEEVKGERK
ncbi:MAG: glycosyltransferase family 4 protein [Gammaproteobacteria bacterium]|nr:glycosyltransferase family 4 protein [Gammaproteobacteria bacterium]